MNNLTRIVITSGDIDGIGTEITSKALQKIKPKRGVQFFLWRSPKCSRTDLRRIDSQFHRVTVRSWPEAMAVYENNYKTVIDIKSALSPDKWVEQSAKACMVGAAHSLVTAPLSKRQKKAQSRHRGHTEILSDITGTKNLYMAFLGKEFNVLLITGHTPFAEVSNSIKSLHVEKALMAANQLKRILPQKFSNRPIALVGLNPHAGEGGLIGKEEEKFFLKALKKVKSKKIKVLGPLVPDASFLRSEWSKYSVYVCPYHDQGLIPFKLVHEHDHGIQITMGLPFVRTSVDHGTAKNIFGKNIANPNSMVEAILAAIKLTRGGAQTAITN